MVAVDVKSDDKPEIISLNRNESDNTFRYVVFSSANKPFNIKITDLLGKAMMTLTSVDANGTIDFSSFSHGLYLFGVFNDSGSSTIKLIY